MAGLLSRLLRARTGDRAAHQRVTAELYDGSDTLEVVGESFHQDVLWEMVGGLHAEPVRFDTHAVLVPEPDNPYDSHAIQVRINGEPVGHLSRHDAVAYLPGLERLMGTGTSHLVALHAQIVGGGKRGDGLGFLGVFLDHNPADFGLEPHHVSHGHLRTGLSDALDTDLVDDSYDLTWRRSLSEDDSAAIRELTARLEQDNSPISRHYLFC